MLANVSASRGRWKPGTSSGKRTSLRSCYLNQVRDAGFSSVKGNAYKSTQASYVVRGGITKAHVWLSSCYRTGVFLHCKEVLQSGKLKGENHVSKSKYRPEFCTA